MPEKNAESRYRRRCIHSLIQGKYSRRPKSERSDFGVLENRSVVESFGFRTTSEIRTISFGFRMFGSLKCIVRFTKLDRFIYIFFVYIKRSSLVEPNVRFKVNEPNVRNPNVR